MSKNPYDVLGISPNASDDEVKRAYRDLTRKYHPDANVNNPLADLAEEKFKEVQEAYDLIMKERESSGSGYGTYGGLVEISLDGDRHLVLTRMWNYRRSQTLLIPGVIGMPLMC